MGARPVQVSIDSDLLSRIDRDPEVKKRGRSAFLRSAVLVYLEARRRRDVDERIRTAYGAKADDLLDEVSDLIREQAWPRD